MASNFMMDQPAGSTKTVGSLAMGINALGAVSGAVAVDFSRGNIVSMTLTGNVTLSFGNVAALAGAGSVPGAGRVVIIFTQDEVGSHGVSWPANAKFGGLAAPVINTAPGARDVMAFVSDGVNLYDEQPANPNFNAIVAGGYASAIQAAAYGATVTPNLALGTIVTVGATNSNPFTIANPLGGVSGMEWTLNLANGAGAALGTVSFGSAYRIGAFTAPAAGKSRVGSLYYDGTYHWLTGGFNADL